MVADDGARLTVASECDVLEARKEAIQTCSLETRPPPAALGVIMITSTRREGLETLARFSCAPGM